MNIIQQENKHAGGRPMREIIYNDVLYDNKEYVVGHVTYNDTIVRFVIDREDYPKIKDLSWHYISNAYICHNVTIENKQKVLYLHNLIMDRLGHPGKGSTETVDHINRIGLDNRKENLRIITQTEQNLNQKRKSRRIELPTDSGLKASDIPKHIWYVKANGGHGDRFAIEMKTENIVWKTTSSKDTTLKEKLQSATEKLQEYYKLTDSYNNIVDLSILQI